MEEKSLPIIIVGHIDHGKSTLVGRLFFDTGSLPPDKLEEIKKISRSLGKEFEFAFILDNLEEERQGEMTIDIAHTFFKTKKRRYVIIDAPGHKEFLKNMITGSSQAEAALLIIDITRGIQEQAKRHCYLLNLIGIKQVAVLVNKMDMVDYSGSAFSSFEKEIESFLGSLKIMPSCILPVCAKTGENVAKKSDKLSWFKGPTVLGALDEFKLHTQEKRHLRFPIQDIYNIDKENIAVGRVEAGIMHENQDVFVLPRKQKCKITKIKKFMQDNLTKAPVGDCVGICAQDAQLNRGEILTDKITATITDSIRANIFWMVKQHYQLGIPLIWKCATQEAEADIERINKRFDSASIDIVENNAKEIRSGEIAEVEIKLDRAVVVDRFTDIREMGRFVLEQEGQPVAGGIIL